MMLGAFSGLSIGASAAGEASSDEFAKLYLNTDYRTPEEKYEQMSMSYTKDGFELRVDPASGEVAVKELATGQIMFSNPYDLGNSIADADSTRLDLLSQLIIRYDRLVADTSGEDDGELNSFQDAVMKQQIKTTRIKNGIRVEYSLGDESTKRLIPFRITDENFQKYILEPIEAAYDNGKGPLKYYVYSYFVGDVYYVKDSLEDYGSDEDKEAAILLNPALEYTDVWTLDDKLSAAEFNDIENAIKQYCTEYTYDLLEEDHAETNYTSFESVKPLFKVSLEYSLDKDGLTVRMPGNGVRYDTNSFVIRDIQVLPYMGAGHRDNHGYTFFPDGAGTIFEFDDIRARTTVSNQPVYGIDFAYNVITETKNQRPIRYPVFGIASNETIYSYTYTYEDKDGNVQTVNGTASNSTLAKAKAEALALESEDFTSTVLKQYQNGFVAIIEEGESLGTIEMEYNATKSEYGSVSAYFTTRPRDLLDLSDMSSTENQVKFYLTSRKYTGSVKIRYKMLTDEATTAEVQKNDPSFVGYDATWMGMAEYYRDYLIENGTISKLNNEDVEADIPLYIETFGAMETQQSFLTLPVNVMTPLTTFANIKTMYDELSADGIRNINFKMTGFANGGLYSTIPSDLEWEDAVGGEEGFKTLINDANTVNTADDDRHLGLYPDFDFAYAIEDKMFDDLTLRDDVVMTMNSRYSSKRIYSATMQRYITFYELAISPSRYDKFYTKLMENYGAYGLDSISLASLGNALNSDFDEDEPYDREDGKKFTKESLNAIKNYGGKNYNVMLDGANAYTWGYADHIINLDLDSSHHNSASAAVPFIGAVLHGYVQYSGAALNEESNIDYALLKAVENGAGLYFILSYQNTTYLKEDILLSQNYSVRYDIWKKDLVSYYTYLNNLLKDVQTKVIVDHKFLNTDVERVLTISEIKDQINSNMQSALDQADKAEKDENLEKVTKLSDARILIANILANKGDIAAAANAIVDMNEAGVALAEKYDALKTEVEAFETFYNAQLAITATGTKSEAQTAIKAIGDKIDEIKAMAELSMTSSVAYQTARRSANKLLTALNDALTEAEAVIRNAEIDETVRNGYLADLANAKAAVDGVKSTFDSAANYEAYYNGGDASAETLAVSILDVTVPETNPYAADLEKKISDKSFTKAELAKLAEVEEEDEEEENNGETTTTAKKDVYAVAKNSVVAVTYGDRYANETGTVVTEAYKTFLLNYNAYAIRISYNGTLYTIPAYGCVAVYN